MNITVNLNISEIIKAVKAVDFIYMGSGGTDKLFINDIATDSRKITADKENKSEKSNKSLFFAIKGERLDGHDFVRQAIENGAAGAVIEKEYAEHVKKINLRLNSDNPAIFILVEDTVQALLDTAKCYKSLFKLNKTVAVTGSVGKTTTKEFIYSVMSQKFKTQKSEGNYNTEIGLPFTLFALEKDTEAIVLEMGMSAFGEISRLSKTANPDIAVITNIGTSHIEMLGSRDGIKKAKFEILDGMMDGIYGSNIILNADESLLYSEKGKTGKKEYFFGINNKSADFIAGNIKFDYELNESYFTVDSMQFKIPTLGIHNIYDAMPAVITGIIYGLTEDLIQNGFNNFENAKMRQNIYDFHGITIIDDCYNASVESVTAALDVLSEVAKNINGRKIAVLSDILEAGQYAEEIHARVGKAVVSKGTDVAYLFGEKSRITAETIESLNTDIEVCKCCYFTDKFKISDDLYREIRQNDVVLFKASRGMALETVLEDFKNKYAIYRE